jgi:hypothetical protein
MVVAAAEKSVIEEEQRLERKVSLLRVCSWGDNGTLGATVQCLMLTSGMLLQTALLSRDSADHMSSGMSSGCLYRVCTPVLILLFAFVSHVAASCRSVSSLASTGHPASSPQRPTWRCWKAKRL